MADLGQADPKARVLHSERVEHRVAAAVIEHVGKRLRGRLPGKDELLGELDDAISHFAAPVRSCIELGQQVDPSRNQAVLNFTPVQVQGAERLAALHQ